jgi:hypothetical protein
MTAGTPSALAVPLGTLMSINVRTWIDQGDGEPMCCLLLTHAAPPLGEADPAAVETTMRRVAASLGAAPAGEPVPDAGVRLTVHGGEALLWFTDTEYALKIAHTRWVRAVHDAGGALLAVGLDELSRVASVAEVDEYREHAHAAGRLHLALARVGRPTGGAS